MSPINIQLADLGRLRRTKALHISAKLDPSELSPILRNRTIRAIKQAYIPTNAYWGVGLLAKYLLKQAGVFYVYSKLRGHVWVGWDESAARIPPEIERQFKELFEADRTAYQVQGGTPGWPSGWSAVGCFMTFYVLNPRQHIQPIMIEYAKDPKYQEKVAPYLELIEAGKPIDFNVQ